MAIVTIHTAHIGGNASSGTRKDDLEQWKGGA